MQFNILCDFDGTVALQDTTDLILSAYADPQWEVVEKQWKAGKIGSAECMRRQIELIDASPAELQALLDEVEIDPYFTEFAEFCARRHLKLIIASDGVDYFIRHILARIEMAHLPIRSNRLVVNSERSYTLAFPEAQSGCASGTCKCALAQASESQTLLIGDGRSDFCLAHQADIVLAKKSLLDYCRQHHLRHAAFEDFSDVRSMIAALIDTPQIATPSHMSNPVSLAM